MDEESPDRGASVNGEAAMADRAPGDDASVNGIAIDVTPFGSVHAAAARELLRQRAIPQGRADRSRPCRI